MYIDIDRPKRHIDQVRYKILDKSFSILIILL